MAVWNKRNINQDQITLHWLSNVRLHCWSLKGNSSHCLALTSFDAPPVALFISKKHIWSKWRNLRWRARPEFRSGPPWLTPLIADLQEPHFLRSAARPCTKFVQNDQGCLFDGFLFDWRRVGWGVNRGREAESCYRVRAQYPSWAVSTLGYPSTTKHNNPIKESRSREGTDISQATPSNYCPFTDIRFTVI